VGAEGGKFAVDSFFGSAFTMITRDANGDISVLAVAGEVSATVFGTLALAALTDGVCSVNTSFPSAEGFNS
jgi:hypothetical protein